MPVLEVRNLKVSYSASGPQILKGIDFAVDGGDFCAVIGPSGAGKTTLFEALLQAGASRVVAGTRAVEDAQWLESVAARWPDRVVVAADVRGDEVVVRGWTAGAGQRVEALLDRLGSLPLGGVLVTDVGREGRMTGVDAPRFAALARATSLPVLASGGVAGADDLEALERAGAAGVVLGMALYTGALDAAAVAREYHT